jgi:hypothetical protein
MLEVAFSRELLGATLVVIAICFVVIALIDPTERSDVEYWAQVHKNNQEKIARNQHDAFLEQIEVPAPTRSKRVPEKSITEQNCANNTLGNRNA